MSFHIISFSKNGSRLASKNQQSNCSRDDQMYIKSVTKNDIDILHATYRP